MKYVVVKLKNTDCTTNEFDSIVDAINFAYKMFTELGEERSEVEQLYVLDSLDQDVNSELHFDGTIIRSYIMK